MNKLISVIIPVYNGGKAFELCLQALKASHFKDWELVVVDDGSTDGSGQLARTFGARVLSMDLQEPQAGPAAARNLGAEAAQGRYLFFIDADCAVHPDTLSRIVTHLEVDPDLDALFGSYDDAPAAPNFVAQYKNLFHHYVHQSGQTEASTFWTGCGLVKRTCFLELGGFDLKRYQRPAIEDIEFGYRLKRAGGRIHLAKDVQVKHLKAWTLSSLLRSDILDRGIPWTRLLLEQRAFTNDLNLQTHNRLSVVLVYLLGLWFLGGLSRRWKKRPTPLFWRLPLGLSLSLLWLNRDLYQFFHRKRGWIFTLKVVPMHWLYYFYNGLSFGLGLLQYIWARYTKK